MNLKLLLAVTIFAAATIVVFAQTDKPNAQPSKPTIEERKTSSRQSAAIRTSSKPTAK